MNLDILHPLNGKYGTGIAIACCPVAGKEASAKNQSDILGEADENAASEDGKRAETEVCQFPRVFARSRTQNRATH
jgi:hypothetical protein